MNGAVQGDAMATASTPEIKASASRVAGLQVGHAAGQHLGQTRTRRPGSGQSSVNSAASTGHYQPATAAESPSPAARPPRAAPAAAPPRARKRQHHTCGVGQPVGALGAPALAPWRAKPITLMASTGKDAGHEVEQQPAQQAADQGGHPAAGADRGRPLPVGGCGRCLLVGRQSRRQGGRDLGQVRSRPGAFDGGCDAPRTGRGRVRHVGACSGQTQHKAQLRRRCTAQGRQRQLGRPDIAFPGLLPVFAQHGSMVEGVGRFGVEGQGLAVGRCGQAVDAQTGHGRHWAAR